MVDIPLNAKDTVSDEDLPRPVCTKPVNAARFLTSPTFRKRDPITSRTADWVAEMFRLATDAEVFVCLVSPELTEQADVLSYRHEVLGNSVGSILQGSVRKHNQLAMKT